MNEITSFNNFDEAKQGELQQWEFPNERKAKQFLKDIVNAGVAEGDLMQKNKKQVIIEILPGSPKVIDSAIAKYSKQNGGKRFNQGRSGPWSRTKRVGESVELDEGQRWADKVSIPASKEITKHIESGKAKILINVPSTLSDKARFVVVKNPNTGSNQDKVLMATISDPKGGRIKMFAFHGSHVSHQKAMDFAKHHKLVAREDANGNPLYAKESVELDEGLTLASDNVNDVKKSAQKLSRSYPDRTYYVIQNKDHHGGWSRYEVVDSVDMHMFKNSKKIIGYGKSVKESVELDEVYYRPGERIKYLHKQWNYAMKQIENSVKVMEKEYSRPSPDWDKIHQEMYNITAYQLQNIKDFIPQKGYKGPLQGSPVDIVDSVEHPENIPEESTMDAYVSYLSKDKTPHPNKSARLSFDARKEDV